MRTFRGSTCRVGRRGRRADERGSVSLFVVLLVPALLAAAGLVLDGGSAVAAKAQAVGDAYAAARAGAQALSAATYAATGKIRADPAAARSAAVAYLRRAGEDGPAHVDVHGRQVHVNVTAASPTRLLNVFGLTAIHVTGRGSATAVYHNGALR
jgi:Flp pilus assembly protein TadG